MEQLKECILNSKKIVVKIGSNVISAEDGTVDRNVLYNEYCFPAQFNVIFVYNRSISTLSDSCHADAR